MSGVSDYAGPAPGLALSPQTMLPSAQSNGVGALIACFRSSIPSPPIPLFTLRSRPRGLPRKTRGRVVRYSFLVRISHPLLPAGLSRRTRPSFLTSFTALDSPRATFRPLPRHFGCCESSTRGITRPGCACLALDWIVGAAEGTNPGRSLPPASTPIFDLGFELTLFIFIHIMARFE